MATDRKPAATPSAHARAHLVEGAGWSCPQRYAAVDLTPWRSGLKADVTIEELGPILIRDAQLVAKAAG
jgi:hypothetical protein